jgi:hypothetical protein
VTLPGPSRTIIVEPIEVPAVPGPERTPEREPEEQPATPEPEREPVPVGPERVSRLSGGRTARA